MSEISTGTIRRWVRSGIRSYEACVQEGMSESKAVDAAARSVVDGDTQEADRIVRSGIAFYMNARDDGILAEDAKEAATTVVSDLVLGEQMARRLRQNVEVDGRVYWRSPEVTIRKADAVDLIGRLSERLVGLGDELFFVFEGYVSPKAGEDGNEV